MTFDEYRLRILERLRACREVTAARDILAEAELMLANSQLTQITRDRFWESVEEELERLTEEAKFLPDPGAAATLGTVLAVARARIAGYRSRMSGDLDEPR